MEFTEWCRNQQLPAGETNKITIGNTIVCDIGTPAPVIPDPVYPTAPVTNPATTSGNGNRNIIIGGLVVIGLLIIIMIIILIIKLRIKNSKIIIQLCQNLQVELFLLIFLNHCLQNIVRTGWTF